MKSSLRSSLSAQPRLGIRSLSLCLVLIVPCLAKDTALADIAGPAAPASSPGSPQATDRGAALRAVAARQEDAELSAMGELLNTPPLISAAVGEPGETLFLERGTTLGASSGFVTHEFTLGSRRDLVFRLATQYKADAGIFTPANAKIFTQGGAATGYAIFNSQFGTDFVTLDAGSYVLAVRNRTASANTIQYELDYDLTVPGKVFVNAITEAEDVAPGRFWQPFTIAEGQFVYVDGVNLDLDFWVITDSQLAAWRAGQTFTYFTAYEPIRDPNQPGAFQLNLPPGSYHLAFRNSGTGTRPVTYTLEFWKNAPVVVPTIPPPSTPSGGALPSGNSGSSGSGGGGSPSGWFFASLAAIGILRLRFALFKRR